MVRRLICIQLPGRDAWLGYARAAFQRVRGCWSMDVAVRKPFQDEHGIRIATQSAVVAISNIQYCAVSTAYPSALSAKPGRLQRIPANAFIVAKTCFVHGFNPTDDDR